MDQLLNHLPKLKRELLAQIVTQLVEVNGIVAVALGGSYAAGTQHAGSDLDIGLYYFPSDPFQIEAIQRIARIFSAPGPLTVTGFYEWGAWVNGGAWIHTPAGKVDFLYRNIDQLQRTVTEANDGVSHHDYDQQPAYGFYSVIYLAELQICIPLYDPQNQLADLKRQVEIYPPNLKRSIIADSLWSAEFSLLHAREFAAQGDVYNTSGCLTRVVSNLTQALFALNERYFLRDKQVMEVIAGFSLLPGGYTSQVERILSAPGSSPHALAETVAALETVWRSVVSLPGVQYESKFII